MKCLACTGRSLGPICYTCWGHGIRWRSFVTMSLCHTLDARRYAFVTLSPDAPQIEGMKRMMFVPAWQRAADLVALKLHTMGIMQAQKEGPTRAS